MAGLGEVKVFEKKMRKLTVQAVRGIASRCESPHARLRAGALGAGPVGGARHDSRTNGRVSTLETLTEQHEEAERLFEAAHDNRVENAGSCTSSNEPATRGSHSDEDGESGSVPRLSGRYRQADAPDVLPRIQRSQRHRATVGLQSHKHHVFSDKHLTRHQSPTARGVRGLRRWRTAPGGSECA